MSLSRREFVKLSAAGMACTVLASSHLARAAPRTGIKAVAFDGFAIFDSRPIVVLAEQFFPGKVASSAMQGAPDSSNTRGCAH